MDAAFWHDKWERNEIGFHLDAVNPLLTQYLDHLNLQTNDCVFLPLCGKTLDIHWLLSQGMQVVGIELHEPAVIALFDALELTPDIVDSPNLRCYQQGSLQVFVGDIFDLTKETLGSVDAVYDRAAIVALPESIRGDYVQHLIKLSGQANTLLINYEYDQTLMSGPPFSVPNTELTRHYDRYYGMTQLYHGEVDGGLKGRCPAWEDVWLLEQR